MFKVLSHSEKKKSKHELQESTIRKKLLSSTRDGTDALINYVDPSRNKQLQE
jgi:hypothetical protein